jgi:hypothetical protein
MKKILLIFLLSLTGCGYSAFQSAYVEADGPCGYVVMIHEAAPVWDSQLSSCLPLDEATKLATQINQDMKANWSGTWQRR